jgi:hypothetical protein
MERGVPTKTLFDYLSDGLSLDYFLESFPSVSRELAVEILRNSQREIEHHAAASRACSTNAFPHRCATRSRGTTQLPSRNRAGREPRTARC